MPGEELDEISEANEAYRKPLTYYRVDTALMFHRRLQRAGDGRAGLQMQVLRATVTHRRDRDAQAPRDPSATTMSVGGKIQHQQAPAFVHRKPVRGGLVLSNAGRSS